MSYFVITILLYKIEIKLAYKFINQKTFINNFFETFILNMNITLLFN